MFNYKLVFSTAFLMVVISICVSNCAIAEKENKNVVAKINNNYTITFDELTKYVNDWLYDKKYMVKSEAYTNALNAMITNQLKRIDFFEKGLDKDSELIQRINRIINEEMVSEYFETQYLGKYANDENAKRSMK